MNQEWIKEEEFTKGVTQDSHWRENLVGPNGILTPELEKLDLKERGLYPGENLVWLFKDYSKEEKYILKSIQKAGRGKGDQRRPHPKLIIMVNKLVSCYINNLTFNVILNEVKNLIFFCILIEILRYFTPQNNIVTQSGRE